MKVGGRADTGATLLKTSISKAGESGDGSVHGSGSSPGPAPQGSATNGALEQPSSKDLLFDALLNQADVSMDKLRSAAWTRVPDEYRAPVWQLLIGYLPLKLNRREEALQRKRKEYFDCLPRYYAR